MTDNYEIEIKCLLGSQSAADSLIKRMGELDSELKKKGVQKQLNHYFEGGNLQDLAKNVGPVLKQADAEKLTEIAATDSKFSLRTRQTNGKLLIILKISIDNTSSDNGTARMEFEAPVDGVTLDELDQHILNSGFSYQAKWSREKTDYNYKDSVVTISFSPGYGYVAEFEKIINDPKLADQTKSELRELMGEVDATELSQDRLARMFEYYNQNWRDYYGTDKVFDIQ